MRRLFSLMALLVVAISALHSTLESHAAPKSQSPTVMSVRPFFGSVEGGQRVTVQGSGFKSAGRVLFGGAAGTSLRVVSSSQLTVTVPAHVSGLVDVIVQTSSGPSRVDWRSKFAFHNAQPQSAVVRVYRSSGEVLFCNPGTMERCGYVTVKTEGFSGPVNCHITQSDYGAYGEFWSQGANQAVTTSNIFDGTSIEVTCDGVVGANGNWGG